MRAALALYESKRDLVTLGAYKKGSDPRLDQVLGLLHPNGRAIVDRLASLGGVPGAPRGRDHLA